MGPFICKNYKNDLDYSQESYATGLCNACRRRLKAKEPINVADWFQKKRQRIEKKGLLSRYHIIDTYSHEWNNLLELDSLEDFMQPLDDFIIPQPALVEMGIKRIVYIFGIYWLIRFNS